MAQRQTCVRSLLNEKYSISRQNRKQLLSELRRQEGSSTILTEERWIDFSKIDTLRFMRDLKVLFDSIYSKACQ
jgi:hypothetical protein